MSWLRRSWRRLQAGPKFDLPYILARANPSDSLAGRVEFCERLLDWIRNTGGGKTTPLARIRFLLQLLERKPEWKEASARVIRSVLQETRAYDLFYLTGIPHGGTFLKEFFSRMVHILLPTSDDSHEMAVILEQVFYDADDAEWVASVPDSLWKEVLDGWIFPRELRLAGYEIAMADAALALSIQGAALSLRTEFASRSPDFGIESHPFLHLEANLASLSAMARRSPAARDTQEIHEAYQGCLKEIERARSQIRSVKVHLEESGVSVDLVYAMDRMKLYLERIETLAGTLESALIDRSRLQERSLGLFRELVSGLRYDGDFGFVFKKSLRLLSTKIVERSGNSGESYFTANWAAWSHLFWAAAGGGALTAITAMLKSFGPNSPPFAAFLYAGMNYSLSFVLMHFLGLKLATKQPSMTAAALAGRLAESESAGAGSASEREEFVEEVARISRAQFAAVAGNLMFVIPVVLIIDLAWRGVYGGSFYSLPKAVAAIESTSLFTSGTLAFAAMTGVVLWVSSIGAGFAENFVVYIRAKEIIGSHRVLKRLVGGTRAKKIGEGLVRHTTGVVGSVMLGFLLAGTPILGEFFGLPIDVRHVTLTTGTLTFSYLAMGSGHGIPLSVLSVMVIGLMNFGVSFAFAILTAMRARNVDLKRANDLFRAARRAFWARPWFFFFPPREGVLKEGEKPSEKELA